MEENEITKPRKYMLQRYTYLKLMRMNFHCDAYCLPNALQSFASSITFCRSNKNNNVFDYLAFQLTKK